MRARARGSPGQAAPATKPKAKLAPKDQALDDLLGKLGESKDEPAPEDHPRRPEPGGGEPAKGAAERARAGDSLGGKDKEIDARLEELAGRRRKRPQPTTKSEPAPSAR